jgi:hypothetical protein
VWSDRFYIGVGETGSVSLRGLVFADKLREPKEFALSLSVAIKRTKMTVDKLCSLPDS